MSNEKPEVLCRFATKLILKKKNLLNCQLKPQCRVISQEAKVTAFSADATTGNGNKSKSAEIWLKNL